MFKGKTLWAIIKSGGLVMYVLIGCSILSLAILFERIIYYKRRSLIKRADFMWQIRKDLEKGQVEKAVTACKTTDAPFASVVLAGLNLYQHNERAITQAMEREITIETVKLERYTSIVGTIGSMAVYVGLLGTVLGIIRAFRDIAVSGAGGINVVIGGISEALACTAAGLIVAIPAVVSYNFFIRRIDNFVVEMELCASELIDLLGAKQK